MDDETDSGGPTKPYWERYGHATKEEFWDQIRADWEYTGLRVARRSRKDVPGASMPKGEKPDRAPSVPARTRQVNVKVTPGDYTELERAARLYGVAPSTMAQLLVNRGVRAVLEGESDGSD